MVLPRSRDLDHKIYVYIISVIIFATLRTHWIFQWPNDCCVRIWTGMTRFDPGLTKVGRHGGLMVSALVPGVSGPGSSPGRGHYAVFLGKTLNSHSASLHPGV